MIRHAGISRNGGKIVRFGNPDCLQDRQAENSTRIADALVAFLAVELPDIRRDNGQQRAEQRIIRIHRERNGFRLAKACAQRSRKLRRGITRALGVKIQPDHVGTGFHRTIHRFRCRQPADLDDEIHAVIPLAAATSAAVARSNTAPPVDL